MWQAPNNKVRAIGSAKKRLKDRNSKTFHLKRVVAELKLIGGLGQPPVITQARVLLNDLSPKGVGLFTPMSVNPDQEVAITFESPRRFYVKGKIIFCNDVRSTQTIISEERYSYRVGLKFTFQNEQEEKEVEAFCQEILEHHLLTKKVA